MTCLYTAETLSELSNADWFLVSGGFRRSHFCVPSMFDSLKVKVLFTT
jgi:hypothetical protein